ncbi:hypothetical protein ACLMJK_007448 [Lecanora helva]
MEADVERPLKEYQSKNREMQNMSTIQGNLAAIAKDVDSAHKKASKLSGGKSSANKVANVTSDVEAADQQWESQAPYVFEQLQSLDETRVNHLRDVLTQLQTHEVDLVERNRTTAESCLNALLNVHTPDEISTFVARMSQGGAAGTAELPRLSSSRSSNTGPPPNAAPGQTPPVPQLPPSSPPSRTRDGNAETATPYSTPPRATTGPPPKSGFGGLRRLGTVLGGRSGKGAKGVERPPSPDKRQRPTRNPLRRGPSSRQDMQTIPSPPTSSHDAPATPPRRGLATNKMSPPSNTRAPPEEAPQRRRNDQLNGDSIQQAPARVSSMPTTNGVSKDQEDTFAPPPGPPPNKAATEETHRDAEGYNVPSSAIDDITRAQEEAAAAGDPDQQQFKLAIRNEPIRDDPDAQNAFSSVASTLRAQASQVPQPRKPGTVRGRRDVRNTVFVPSGQSLESTGLGSPIPSAPLPALGLASPPLPGPPSASDAQSIRSAHSVNSLANPSAAIHPQMHQPGLNASIVETVSATFEKTQVTKATVIGELALQHNPNQTASPSGTESIRLENFPVLEKVAPNPTFINQIPSKSGEYTVNLSQVSRPSVAFKYQVHLDDTNLAAHAPISITPIWKIEPSQTSVIMTYAFNPAFVSPAKRSVSLKNVMVVIPLENAKALSCQSKPLGIFAKERSLVYWKLGDMTLDGYAEAPQKLLARFSTESEAKPGNVEVRWEISGEAATGLGSGLGLSQMAAAREEGGSDPFADEGSSTNVTGNWKEIPAMRKIISGRYIAQ